MKIAIGAIKNNSTQGHVRVYKNTDGTWNQLGQDIDGETQNDYFGSMPASLTKARPASSLGVYPMKCNL